MSSKDFKYIIMHRMTTHFSGSKIYLPFLSLDTLPYPYNLKRRSPFSLIDSVHSLLTIRAEKGRAGDKNTSLRVMNHPIRPQLITAHSATEVGNG